MFHYYKHEVALQLDPTFGPKHSHYGDYLQNTCNSRLGNVLVVYSASAFIEIQLIKLHQEHVCDHQIICLGLRCI